MARRYLLRMLLGALAAVACAAAYTWFMDPLGIYASPRIEGLNAVKPWQSTRFRTYKTVAAASGRWDALIVGTSRAEVGLDPQHEFFRGTRCFNAAIAGESYDELLALVRVAGAAGNLRKVVAMLDFEAANAHYAGAPDFSADNYRPWRKAALAVNGEMFALAARMPFAQDRERVAAREVLWLGDGRALLPPRVGGPRVAAIRSENQYLHENLFQGPQRAYALASATAKPLERIRELATLARAKRIELSIVIGPVHARQLETIAAAGLWDTWEDWKRRLVEIVEAEAAAARAAPFPLWDFSGYTVITTEAFPPLRDARPMRWYHESSHFRVEAGNAVLDRLMGRGMTDFGARLDGANIDSHLRAAREARAKWRRENPGDAAEIEAMRR